MGTGFMLLNSILTSLISSQASSNMQGVVQGITRTFASVMRGLGPIVCGAVFSFGEARDLPSVSFIFLSAGYIGAFALLSGVPRRVLEITRR
jgi:MFS family permease